jgi:tryptophanyl-tRNA synthetase
MPFFHFPHLTNKIQKYKKGELLTGEVKKILADVLSDVVVAHQQARARVTDDVLDAFMTVRELNYAGKHNK